MAETPYRDALQKPIEIKGGTLVVAIDALVTSLRISGAGFRFGPDERERAANTLLKVLNDTTYSVVKVDGETSP